MKIFDVIKYEGDNHTFVWKYPGEDFNTFSQLIVHESQEAILYIDGQICDLFGPGKYTLDTENIPILRRFLNIPTGGVSSFHCEVYFVNKTEQMAIRWGTDSRVQYIEPIFGFPVEIGASGEMSLRIEDSRKVLEGLVGTEDELSQEKLVRYFRAFLMTRVKTYIAQIMKARRINIFEIDEQLFIFSECLKELLNRDFDEYGVTLECFFVTNVVKPEGDPHYEKAKELYFRQYADIADARLQQQVGIINQETEAKRMVIESEALAKKREQEGYTYQQERRFDVAEKAAVNQVSGEFTGLGIGLGAMAGLGGVVGKMVGDALDVTKESSPEHRKVEDNLRFCENCGAKLYEGADFCEECGYPIVRGKESCSNCGYVFERPGKFCPKCGTQRGTKEF